jgi:hypothetical protein
MSLEFDELAEKYFSLSSPKNEVISLFICLLGIKLF